NKYPFSLHAALPIYPLQTVPVLDVEGREAILREGHRLCRGAGSRVIILHGEDINLVDWLCRAESYLHPVGEDSRCRIVPASIAGAPACPAALTVDDTTDRKGGAVG